MSFKRVYTHSPKEQEKKVIQSSEFVRKYEMSSEIHNSEYSESLTSKKRASFDLFSDFNKWL